MRAALITFAGIVAWSALLWYSVAWEPRASVDPLAKDLFEDPPLGLTLPLPKADAQGKALNPRRPRFAVFMGDCESCSIRRADPSKISPKAKVVFIFQGPARGLTKLKEFQKRGACIFADNRINEVSRRMSYVPRAVELGGEGKIVRIQSYEQSVEEFCAR